MRVLRVWHARVGCRDAARGFSLSKGATGWNNPNAEPDLADGSNAQLQELELKMAARGFVLKRIVTRKSKMGGMMSWMAIGMRGGADESTMGLPR